MLEIPPERLPKETLRSIVESFVLREGTDYGVGEYSLEDKIGQVLRQIARKDIVVTFDPLSESCNLLTRKEWNAYCAQQENTE